VSVEVLSGPVVAHGGAGVGVAGSDLHIAQVDASVEHGGDESVPQHVWVYPRQVHTGSLGEAAQQPGGAVAVRASAASAAQDGAGVSPGDGGLDGAAHRGGQWHECGLIALAADPQHPVFVRWYEEPALVRRFGSDYEQYRRAVPAWRPRLRPWSSDESGPRP